MDIESFLGSGRLELETSKIVLSRTSRAKEVRKSVPKGRRMEECNSGEEYTFMVFDVLFDTRVAITPIFRAGLLKVILLQPNLVSQTVWPETREKLEEYANGCRQWLFDKMGIELPARFSWGEMEIVVSTRSWDTPIVISYD